MTDPNAPDVPAGIADLPMQPTGSGVADLETAYEQMKLAEDDAATTDGLDVPTIDGEAAAESAAHPS
jgi:hypothetical protein